MHFRINASAMGFLVAIAGGIAFTDVHSQATVPPPPRAPKFPQPIGIQRPPAGGSATGVVIPPPRSLGTRAQPQPGGEPAAVNPIPNEAPATSGGNPPPPTSERSESFWTTIPGILTALAAFIAAIATLVKAFRGSRSTEG
ncbi:MAG: hypothetical protein ABIR58_06625 [Gemmatimonadaceae bacterium]